MSADNGIYIVGTLTKEQPEVGKEYEYRVRHCQAIENVFHPGPGLNIHYLWSYFHKGGVFGSYKDALIHAGELAEQEYVLEYGITSIGKIDIVFPTEEEANNQGVLL